RPSRHAYTPSTTQTMTYQVSTMGRLGALVDLARDETQEEQSQHEVEPGESDQREHGAALADRVADAVVRAQQAVDEPGLAAELRRHPARDVRDERKRERQHQH